MFSGQLAQAAITSFQRSQDTLFALAKDTGGRALFDYNDPARGIVQAAESVSSYYILGYYSTHPAPVGIHCPSNAVSLSPRATGS